MLKMKGSSPRRGEYYETGKPIPPSTAIEPLQRVADWTKNSHALPPSMGRKTAKQFENEDHEEKSQLIVEAVRMLDTRDKQIRSKPTTARQTAELLMDDADISIDEDHQQRIARLYVKDFGEKLKQRRYYEPTMLTSLPVVKGRKGVGPNRPIIDLNNSAEIGPVVEPESWRFKASRSMKFTVKPIPSQASNNKRGGASISGSDDKWTLKPENDRDWWKWKLKQGFLQNDELLQKLVSQRHTLEATFKPVERLKAKQKPVSRNASLSPFPSNQNSSRHVTVQIPFQSKLLRSKNVESSSRGLQQPKTREPIPNFYHPAKCDNCVTLVNTPEDPTQKTPHKPVSLKQDPYLTKLLAGSQMFKPDAMLDVHQPSRRHEFTQQNVNADNLNRKISLESLTDSDDDFAARKFFTPDIKVLYERLSDNMENLPTNPIKEQKLSSREPSDGYVNLPILLATGRFSRFNKLPSVKALNEPSKGNTRKPGGVIAKVRTTSRFTNNKFVNKTNNVPKRPQSYDRIEDLPTKDWAKKVMEKSNKQQGSIIVEERSDSGTLTVTTLDNSDFGHPDHINLLQNRHSNNMKHIDQEMNMLYHDILMSKWKKDKHDREVAARKNAIIKLKKGAKSQSSKKLTFSERKDFPSDKPRGLDIWLENIREKAKRDRVISPHNLKEQFQSDKNQPPPPLVKTFENTAFSITRDL